MEINVTPDSSGPYIEAGDQDFEAKVLERSHQVPVLVDFWAPWCGPCKVIGPVLEKLVQDWNGRFELVKVNMDESPMLAQALRIQSIPAVKLFINGRIQDEFMGAYPEPEIVRFLEHNLPSEKASDAMVGLQLWQAGDDENAMRVFQQVLSNEPKNPVALIGMGHCLVDQGDTAQARELADQVNEAELEKLNDRQQTEKLLSVLRSRIHLVDVSQGEPPAGDAAPVYAEACRNALAGRYEEALEALLGIVKTDRKYGDDAARKAMIAVFDLLPPDSPVLAHYRQQLSNWLFA